MDKKCTSCGKTVYPLEQLKCLDQIWHKQCFKCEVCGMTLNMKNYKGLEKKPYCSAHYPQPKAYTFVSDNPEMQRVKQNTAVISNVKYHEEFEKSKGAKMAVTEDMLLPSAQAVKRQPAPPTAHPTNAAVEKSVKRRGSADVPVGPAAAAPAAAPGSIFAYDPALREAAAEDSAADQPRPRETFDPHAAKRGSTIYSSEESQQSTAGWAGLPIVF